MKNADGFVSGLFIIRNSVYRYPSAVPGGDRSDHRVRESRDGKGEQAKSAMNNAAVVDDRGAALRCGQYTSIRFPA